jgi:hypothetical protein
VAFGGGTVVAFGAGGGTSMAFGAGGGTSVSSGAGAGTAVAFGGSGLGVGIRYHALGGPSVDDVPSNRAYVVSHADAPLNIHPMSVTELMFHPEMSALNANAPLNIYHKSVTELVSHLEMSALNADAPPEQFGSRTSQSLCPTLRYPR